MESDRLCVGLWPSGPWCRPLPGPPALPSACSLVPRGCLELQGPPLCQREASTGLGSCCRPASVPPQLLDPDILGTRWARALLCAQHLGVHQTRWGDNGTGPAGPCAPRLVTPHPPPAQRRLSPPVARFRLRGDAHRAHRDPVLRGVACGFICKVLIPSLGLPFPSVSHAWGSLPPLLALRVTSSRGAPPFPEPLVASLSGAVRPRALGCLPQPLGNVTGTQPQAWPSPVPAPGLAVCSAGTSSPWGPPSSATERPSVGCSPCLGPEPLPCTSWAGGPWAKCWPL